jgi:hypothetical protein
MDEDDIGRLGVVANKANGRAFVVEDWFWNVRHADCVPRHRKRSHLCAGPGWAVLCWYSSVATLVDVANVEGDDRR